MCVCIYIYNVYIYIYICNHMYVDGYAHIKLYPTMLYHIKCHLTALYLYDNKYACMK